MTMSQVAHLNGNGVAYPSEPILANKRFSDIPSAIDIPVQGGLDAEEAVEVNLEDLFEDPTELCTLLENEGAARSFWMIIALAYAKQRKVDHAIEMLTKGLGAMARGGPKEKLSILSCLCWLYLWKSREAPRLIPEGTLVSEARTKDFYLQASTATLNEASRINPSFPPLFLARGVLYLLRASLQPPAKPSGSGSQDQSERLDNLRQAAKCFEDALRVSGGKNMMAVLGKSRAQFSMGRYSDALDGYQEVLLKMPGLTDPDPRIGAGCCFWQLGYKDDAKIAWERSLEINPSSKIANILLGLYYLNSSASLDTSDPKFIALYKKAMTEYTQRAFKLDKDSPLTCATFGGYFLSRKAMPTVESLARKAIELTDVNAVASDGWYLLARKEHLSNETSRSSDFYRRADEARGGGDRGYLPAKFGIAQLQILLNDLDGAKFRLEKIIQHSKNLEAMVLLGTLYAEDVFANQGSGLKEDKSGESKKAIALLETVRMAWKDSKKNTSPDASVLLNLARLYEADQPEKSLQCLQQVEKMEMDEIPDDDRPEDIEDEAVLMDMLREHLPPQLLNNAGCFQYQAEKYHAARGLFQTALSACVKIADRDDTFDTDALVTTISYNLARTYEADNMLDEAKKVYEGLLERHDDYTEANARLAHISLRQSPGDEGPKRITKLIQTDPTNLEVRGLYGWFLSKSKKRSMNIAEDSEQRHYKHTLQHHDKHDRYSLTGMGNIYLTTAREMRRDTDSDKEKRRNMYGKAVEFFDKALQLDPRNAYAAQGIAIALVEDRKEHGTAVQMFTKIRDTVKDSSVLVNLGHLYAELKQYSRAIENYEAALSKDRVNDAQILACLGRVWLLKGKQDKNIAAMKNSLDYSHKARDIAKDQLHFQFNIAFVQIQVAQLVYTLNESQRTLEEVQNAAHGLDEAIESLTTIAQAKNPPYPKNEIEQRANMGRNTMRRQLERAVQSQREYEEKNAAKLHQAREIRQAELKRREEEKRKAEEIALEQKRRIAEERHRMQERDRELAERREEEERKKEELEYTTDEETGEKVKRKKRAGGGKRKKAEEDVETDGTGSGADGYRESGRKSRGKSANRAPASDDEGVAPKKRRKLERKNAGRSESKFKSSEIVVESESEEDAGHHNNEDDARVNGQGGPGSENEEKEDSPMEIDEKVNEDDGNDDDEEDDEANPIKQRQRSTRKKISRAIGSDSEDDEQDGGGVEDLPKTNGSKAPSAGADEGDEDDGMEYATAAPGNDAGSGTVVNGDDDDDDDT
ncbi:MAG: hypothetical protein M1837_000657 [Sclerophora amabilis]|nr:MAG: hypothetical protein M1837_000657 [Sclerophora amabilis]